jgi:hypothetical protein
MHCLPALPTADGARSTLVSPSLQVAVYGRQAGDSRYTLVASPTTAINWKAAERAKLTILPAEEEWPALVARAGTL